MIDIEELEDKFSIEGELGFYEQDEGIQLITVTVTFFEEEEPEKQSQFELVGYKTKARWWNG